MKCAQMALVAALVMMTAPGALAQADEQDDDGSIHLVVGPGAEGLESVAVPDALCKGASASICDTVSRVIRRDLQISFYFRVLKPKTYLADPEAEGLENIAWPEWTNVGARFLVKAEVTGPEPVSIQFRLFDVSKQTTIAVRGQSVSGLKEGSIRRATHRFCNGILEVLTGIPGVFDTRIAYASKTGPGKKSITVMDMDGAGRTGHTSNDSINMLPAWGFGGLLYTSFLGGVPELYFGKRKLSRDSGHYRKVAVSSEGQMVASISYGGQSDLFLMSRTGEIVRNLTNSAADEVSPTFSPDGTKIAYVSSAAGAPQIYVMNISGGSGQRITHQGGYNYAPDWGPNNVIVYASMEGSASDLFAIDPNGERVQRLTQSQGVNKDPTWSPDGRYIAFYSRRSGGSGVYLMSSDGRHQFMVSKGGGRSNLAWQR